MDQQAPGVAFYFPSSPRLRFPVDLQPVRLPRTRPSFWLHGPLFQLRDDLPARGLL